MRKSWVLSAACVLMFQTTLNSSSKNTATAAPCHNSTASSQRLRKIQDASRKLKKIAATKRHRGMDGLSYMNSNLDNNDEYDVASMNDMHSEVSKECPTMSEIETAARNLLACTLGSHLANNNIHAGTCTSSLKTLRYALCCTDPPAPIQFLIDNKVVDALVYLLKARGLDNGRKSSKLAVSPEQGQDQAPTDVYSPNEVMRDSIWCLTNIATGTHEQTSYILQAVPELLHIIEGADTSLSEQACWTIGNIAGDSDDFRTVLVANGVILPLLNFLRACVSTAMDTGALARAQTASWALSNAMRGSVPATVLTEIPQSVPFVLSLLSTSFHSNIALFKDYATNNIEAKTVSSNPDSSRSAIRALQVELWWILAFLTAKDDLQIIQEMLHQGLGNVLIEAFSTLSAADITAIPTIRTLGNITSGPLEWIHFLLMDPSAAMGCVSDSSRTNPIYILFSSFIRIISSIHRDGELSVLKETMWVISNICACSDFYRYCCLQSGLVDGILDYLQSNIFELEREGLWALCNACQSIQCLDYLLFGIGKVLNQEVKAYAYSSYENSLTSTNGMTTTLRNGKMLIITTICEKLLHVQDSEMLMATIQLLRVCVQHALRLPEHHSNQENRYHLKREIIDIYINAGILELLEELQMANNVSMNVQSAARHAAEEMFEPNEEEMAFLAAQESAGQWSMSGATDGRQATVFKFE